jgi:hypothetical protein
MGYNTIDGKLIWIDWIGLTISCDAHIPSITVLVKGVEIVAFCEDFGGRHEGVACRVSSSRRGVRIHGRPIHSV